MDLFTSFISRLQPRWLQSFTEVKFWWDLPRKEYILSSRLISNMYNGCYKGKHVWRKFRLVEIFNYNGHKNSANILFKAAESRYHIHMVGRMWCCTKWCIKYHRGCCKTQTRFIFGRIMYPYLEAYT